MGWLVSGTIYVDGGDPASLRLPTSRRAQAPAHTDEWVDRGSPVSQPQPHDAPSLVRGPIPFRPSTPDVNPQVIDTSSPMGAPYWEGAQPARSWRSPPFRPTESDRYPFAGDLPIAPISPGWDMPQGATVRARPARAQPAGEGPVPGAPVSTGLGLICEWQGEQAPARRTLAPRPSLAGDPPHLFEVLDQSGVLVAPCQDQPGPVRRSPAPRILTLADAPALALVEGLNAPLWAAAIQPAPDLAHRSARPRLATDPAEVTWLDLVNPLDLGPLLDAGGGLLVRAPARRPTESSIDTASIDTTPQLWLGVLLESAQGLLRRARPARPVVSIDDSAADLLVPIAAGLAVPFEALGISHWALVRVPPTNDQCRMPNAELVLDVSQAQTAVLCPDALGGIVYRPRPWRASESYTEPSWIAAGVVLVAGPYWAVALDLSPVGIVIAGEVT